MKTSPVTHQDLRRSVIAVPPLARRADLSLNEAANRALLAHLEAGGVRSVMYGGNANYYNVGLGEYARIVDMLAALAGPDTWILPSAGPDYGKMMDQAAVLRTRAFPRRCCCPCPSRTRTMAWRMACGASQTRWPSRPWSTSSRPATWRRRRSRG